MNSSLPRRAGTAQGLTLVILSVMPILAIAALVADLPLLLDVFHDVPNHEFLVPMILTVPSACVALFASVTGVVADRWGRRPLLLVALLMFSVLGVLPLWFDSLPAIIASRAVVGLAEAAILTCCNTLWGDYFPDDERKRWLARQQMCGPVFNALLAVAGGVLAALHWRFPFLLYATGIPVLLLATLFLWEPRRVQTSAAAEVSSSKFPWPVTLRISAATLGVSVVFFILAIQQGRVYSTLGVASAATIGLLIMIASIGAIAGAFVFNWLRARSIADLLALGLAAYGIGYVGISWVSNPSVATAFNGIAQIGSSIVLPALIAWALTSYRFEHRGRGVGIWGACFFIGQFLSALVLTLIEHALGGFLRALLLVGIVTLFAAGVSWGAARRVQQAGSGATS